MQMMWVRQGVHAWARLKLSCIVVNLHVQAC